MSQLTYLTHSIDDFSAYCHGMRASLIEITFSPTKNKEGEIEFSSPVGLHELVIVPLQITTEASGKDTKIYHKIPSSVHRAKYHKLRAGDGFILGRVDNEFDLWNKAARYAEFRAKHIQEYAEGRNDLYDFRVQVYLNLIPHKQKEMIREIASNKIKDFPPAEDIEDILSRQHSRP